ncbi:MAG: hypothetical protein QW117_03300 [Candidatus Pacearchaeota archaeon]
MANPIELPSEEREARDKVFEEMNFIAKLIATVSPDIYCKKKAALKVKQLLREGKFWEAVEKAEPIEPEICPERETEYHKIVFDSSMEALEPIYFWIVDFLQDSGGKFEKLIDNFSATPGSGNFSELMGKATRMQEEIMKIMQTIGVLIKSILNIIYDLKEFEIRLDHYKKSESKNKAEREAGLLALKQIWLDNVDIKRGIGSINALTRGDLNFVTLRDAFMLVNDPKEVDYLDLNDRVKRLLKPRIAEFLEWKKRSYAELTKRYNIERAYLKSQLNSLKLYTKWAQPYLKAAAQLEQRNFNITNPYLVTAFNTIVLEMLLFTQKKIDPKDLIYGKNKMLPEVFEKISFKRDYYACVFIDFIFRSYPVQTARGGISYSGRAEVHIQSFALNSEEIKLLKEKINESSFNETLKLASGMTEEAINELKDDIEYFLSDEREKEGEKNEITDVNPFLALFGFYNKSTSEKKNRKEKINKKEKKQELLIKPDNFYEKILRKIAQEEAAEASWNFFDKFKKSRGWAAHPGYGEFV